MTLELMSFKMAFSPHHLEVWHELPQLYTSRGELLNLAGKVKPSHIFASLSYTSHATLLNVHLYGWILNQREELNKLFKCHICGLGHSQDCTIPTTLLACHSV